MDVKMKNKPTKKTGLTIFTSFKIESISELGKDYRVKIKESVGKVTWRFYKTTCGVQDISDSDQNWRILFRQVGQSKIGTKQDGNRETKKS